MKTGAFGDKSKEKYTFDATSETLAGPESIAEAIGWISSDGDRFLDESSW